MSKTPKLRFKEFSGDWENKKISEIYSDLKAGSTPSKAVPRYFKGNIPWITSGELKTKYIYKTNEYITEEAVKSANLKIYEEGTFFIAITGLEAPGTRGSCAINKVKATTNQSCLAFQKNSKMKNEFLYYWYLLNGEHIGIKYTQGTKQQSLNNELVGKLRINMPSIEEQEKIASFFSLIDDKISLQGDKVEALKDYKKGIMQNIFSRELRFKDDDGRDYPEWENIRLSEVLKERKTYSQKNEGLEHVTLSKDGIYGKGERYNRDFLVVTDDKKYKITRLGDICYNPANLKFGVICRNDYGDAIFSPIYVTFEVKSEADSEYMGVYLSRWDFINRVRKYEEGTVYERMAVKPEDFLRFEINLPTIEEQKKIKGLFNKIDEKVKFEEEKLNRLNEYKKGLLQQMFV